MWFKVFVLLRIPISIIAMLGYGVMLSAWGGPHMAFLGGMFVVGPFIFLAFTSIRLVRHRKGALSLAWWLLALESLGAVLLVSGGDYMAQGRFDPLMAFVVACVLAVVWTLPNAVLLYRARSLFTEPTKEKPGE
jgi:hypothetical protein